MCGIAGYIGKKKLELEKIEYALDSMKHRGPDGRDFRSFQNNETNCSLLHARLSIIDLDGRSNQPFTIGDYTVIFNGEIYNYVELRKELEKDGVPLRTTSDTEVLLHYFIRYGESCLQYFEGMWAFAIYNTQTQSLFVSRDRFAEKPFYYTQTNDGWFFASEVKTLQALTGKKFKVNRQHILRYLVNGYKSLYKSGETFFEEVQEVPFASFSFVTGKELPQFYKYWLPDYQSSQMSLEEAIVGSRERLIESMKIRLRADVPLAFCLSGGVDSASLVSIAAKVFKYDAATFSIIDSDSRYNEEDNIRATIEDTGCKHTLIHISHEGMLERLRQLVEYHDAPVATISYLIHSMLSEEIHRNGYKVAFSGTSADELFTGYYDHFLLHLNEVKNHENYETYLQDWQEHTGKFVRNPHLKNPRLYAEMPNFRKHVFDNSEEFHSFLRVDFTDEFTEKDMGHSLLRKRMLNELFYECTPVILHEDDLNSMFYSIENRSPFLDTRLFEFAYSIPPEYLILDGYGKYVLREAMSGILNDKVRLDRRKKGFNASINSLFDLQSKEIREYFLNPELPIFEMFDYAKISALFDLNPAPNEYSKFLFSFMNTVIFLDQHQ